MNMLIIEINKAEQAKSEFNEFHRMNNSDEIIEANPTLAGRQLANHLGNHLSSHHHNMNNCGFSNELMMNFVYGNGEESDSSAGQRSGYPNYAPRSMDNRRQTTAGEILTGLSPPKVGDLIPYDNADYAGYHYTNSLIEYDDLYVVDQPADEPLNQRLTGEQLMDGQLMDGQLINNQLMNGQQSIDPALIGQSLLYNKQLLSEDLDLSTLIVPPPPKLDSNLEEQDELLRNFQKATDELKNICQSCQNGNAVAADADYGFGSNVQVVRDLHSSSSADSGYESVLLINNSQKLVDINQKLISSSLSGFADSRPANNYVLANHCTVGRDFQPPKAPPRFNKLKGNLRPIFSI